MSGNKRQMKRRGGPGQEAGSKGHCRTIIYVLITKTFRSRKVNAHYQTNRAAQSLALSTDNEEWGQEETSVDLTNRTQSQLENDDDELEQQASAAAGVTQKAKPKTLVRTRQVAFQHKSTKEAAYGKLFRKMEKQKDYVPMDFRVIRDKANADNSVIADAVTTATKIRVRCSTDHVFEECKGGAVCICEERLSDWSATEQGTLSKIKYKLLNGLYIMPLACCFIKSMLKRKIILRKDEPEYFFLFKLLRDTINKPPPRGVTMIQHSHETAKELTGYSPKKFGDDGSKKNMLKGFPDCFEFVPDTFRKSSPAEQNNFVTCFYYHGGGFMFHSPQFEFKQYLGKLAKLMNIRIFAPDYRKTPYHPYPTPVNDCYDWTIHLLDHRKKYGINENNFCIMGDSAGGTCVLSVLYRLYKNSMSYKPFYISAISPVCCGAFYDLPSFHDPVSLSAFPLEAYQLFALSFTCGLDYHDADKPHGKGLPYKTKRNQFVTQSCGLLPACGYTFDSACTNTTKYLPIEDVPAEECFQMKNKNKNGLMAEFGGELNGIIKDTNDLLNPEIAFFFIETEDLKKFISFYKHTKFHFTVAEYDSTRDEILMVANRMIELEAKVTWSISRDQPHDFPFRATFLGGWMPTADKTTAALIEDMKEFIEFYREGGKKNFSSKSTTSL